MLIWQKLLILCYGIFSLIIAFVGLKKSSKKMGGWGHTPWIAWTGAFVWADVVIFGFFWFIVSAISLIVNDWITFWFLWSIFWVVRSLGETIYWFNQQFTPLGHNAPEKLRGYRFFKDQSLWFVYQIIWQCINVFAIVALIYFGKIWLAGL